MSLFELLLVVVVGFFVLKPEDIRLILAKVKQVRSFINSTKQEIMSHIDPDITDVKNSDSYNFKEEMEQVNFYLEKIANLDSEYQGEYSLPLIKEHYRKLINSKINDIVKDDKNTNLN